MRLRDGEGGPRDVMMTGNRGGLAVISGDRAPSDLYAWQTSGQAAYIYSRCRSVYATIPNLGSPGSPSLPSPCTALCLYATISTLARRFTSSTFKLYSSSISAALNVPGPFTSGRAAATSAAMLTARTLSSVTRVGIDSPSQGAQQHVSLHQSRGLEEG